MGEAVVEKEMTFREFVDYAEFFEYSEEYYDLYKECSELTLMEMYTERQDFIIENEEYLPESACAILFTEGKKIDDAKQFINKKAGEAKETIGKIKENIGEKKTKIWEQIKRIWNAIWTAISEFVRRIKVVFSGADAERINSQADKIANDASLIEKLKAKAKDIRSKWKNSKNPARIFPVKADAGSISAGTFKLIKEISSAAGPTSLDGISEKLGGGKKGPNDDLSARLCAAVATSVEVDAPKMIFEIDGFLARAAKIMKDGKVSGRRIEALKKLLKDVQATKGQRGHGKLSAEMMDSFQKTVENAKKDWDAYSDNFTSDSGEVVGGPNSIYSEMLALVKELQSAVTSEVVKPLAEFKQEIDTSRSVLSSVLSGLGGKAA